MASVPKCHLDLKDAKWFPKKRASKLSDGARSTNTGMDAIALLKEAMIVCNEGQAYMINDFWIDWMRRVNAVIAQQHHT